MTIILKPEHERMVIEVLRNGAYESADEVIGRALETLHSDNNWLFDHRELIEAKIERSLAQFESGEFFSPDESRADMERRKSEWLSGHSRP